MIVDQNCQTNAPTAKLFVSSEPEIWCNDVLLAQPDDVRGLCAAYQSFIKKIERCQSLAGFSRFRVYGEIRQDDQHCMVLVTEFRRWKDDDEFWNQLGFIRDSTEAHTWIMEDAKETQHYPAYTNEEDQSLPDSFGPNHDREYLQVELSWRIEAMNYKEIQSLIERLKVATDQVWEESGVGVC